jgi:hypothetical protein
MCLVIIHYLRASELRLPSLSVFILSNIYNLRHIRLTNKHIQGLFEFKSLTEPKRSLETASKQ